MGQILHGSARTTEAVHRAIQNSQERIARLARRYNLPAAGRWARNSHAPRAYRWQRRLWLWRSCLLQAGRKHTLLPLDDFLYAL